MSCIKWSGVQSFAAVLLLFMVCGVLCPAAWADGYRNPPAGAVGLGRAGVYVAQCDDASSVSFNPANMALVERPSVLAAFTLGRSEIELDSPLFGKECSDAEWVVLPNLYGVMPIGTGAGKAAGVGLTTPFGQSVEWDPNGPLRYSVPYFAEIELVNVNPSFAMQVSEKVSIGVGADVYVSTLSYHQLADNGPVPGEGKLLLDADGTGLGGNVALSVDLTEVQRLALTYRSGFEIDYEGDARLRGMAVPVPGRTDYESEIGFPAAVALGYGIRVSDSVRVEFDVEWLEHSSNDSIPIDTDAYDGLIPPEIVNDWDDTWTFGVGADWNFKPGWTLYGGYAFVESPIPDNTYVPMYAESDRHAISLGLGYECEGRRIVLSYAASLYEDRDVDDNLNPALNGSYEYESHLIGLSCSVDL